jgi:hypothetical protein
MSLHALQEPGEKENYIYTIIDTIIILRKPKAPRGKTTISKSLTNGGRTNKFTHNSAWQGENCFYL